jgi:NADH-quinone oxidoreductase subunit N
MGFNWRIIFPEIAVLVTGFVLLILDLFLRKFKNGILTAISVVGTLTAMWLVFDNWSYIGVSFQGIVANDPIAFFFKIIFCIGTLLTILVSTSYVKREMKSIGEYYVLLFMATFGMMVMASSTDLLTIFLGLEVMSMPLYVLAGIYRQRPRSREASMKYFLMGAFASGFLLYGIALIFGAFGSTNMIEISERLGLGGAYSGLLVGAGMTFLLIGIGFKVAVVPFHMWVPDVYEGSAAPVTAFMSAGPKAAGFAALFRIFSVFWPVLSDNFTTVLWILAVLTMTWGNVLAISQSNIKRMLAYSSIAHAGYVMIALTVGGKEGLAAAAFYLLVYTIINIGAFAVVIFFAGQREKLERIADYSGFGIRYPFEGISLTVFMLALAGIPATAGFVGKYKIFMGAIDSGFVWLAIIGIINSLVSVWYYIYVVVTMYMKPAAEKNPKAVLPPSLFAALLISLFGTLYLGLFPGDWLSLANWVGSHEAWTAILRQVLISL